MLGDEGFRIPGSSFQGWQGAGVGGVAERDAHIAQKSAAFDASQRRLCKLFLESGLVE
jgi:hypothetical protein